MFRSLSLLIASAAILLIGLSACSSSSGDGGKRPADVTVVSPPNSTVETNVQ